ncbi:protein kinase domain-containing protein [Endozoicomonas sp. ALD040]|uniref:protein kinase domain-containing protein n=3 Tax=Endozoicomonas TaxID=305899 RepID=UPI003BB11780
MNIRMDAHIPTLTESGSPTIVVHSSASNGNSSPTDQSCLRNPCNIASSAYHYVLGRFRRVSVNEQMSGSTLTNVNGQMLNSTDEYVKEDYFVVRREVWDFPEGPKILMRKCYEGKLAKNYLKHEKKMLRAAQGPNIVPLIETKGTNILMPYAGETLRNILDRDSSRGLPLPRFENYARQLMQGVAHLHHSGIWHLDLKPANVVVDEDNDDKLSIIDFGVSQRAGPARQKVLCAEGHKPPEMFYRGPKTLSGKTDIFSAGVILFRLLTNDRPFSGVLSFCRPTCGVMMEKDRYNEYLDDQMKKVEAIDKRYGKLIRSMLAWNPKDRPDADEVLGFFMGS